MNTIDDTWLKWEAIKIELVEASRKSRGGYVVGILQNQIKVIDMFLDDLKQHLSKQ